MSAPEVIRSKTRPLARKRWEFALEFYRDDAPEVHTFLAYPTMDVGSLSYTLSATRKPERAVEGMVRSIKKMLADDDGTPVNYRPRPYQPDAEEPDADRTEATPEEIEDGGLRQAVDAVAATEQDGVEDDELDLNSLYIGPDGEPQEAEAIQTALEFNAGSSRRRFAYLMDTDEDLTLQVDQLEALYRKLVGQAANRPTRR